MCLLSVTVAVVAAIAGPPTGFAAEILADRSGDELRRAQSAITTLREPLTPSERHLWLASFAHLWGGSQPHRLAIERLAATSLPIASFALVEVARDPTFPFRREAIAALGSLPHRTAIPTLLSALEDADSSVRIAALSSLVLFARDGVLDHRMDEVLARVLRVVEGDPDGRVRGVAHAATSAFGLKGIFAFNGLPRGQFRSITESCRDLRLRAFFAQFGDSAWKGNVVKQLRAEVGRPTAGHLARVRSIGERIPTDGFLACVDPRSEAIRLLDSLDNLDVEMVEEALAPIAEQDPDPSMRAAAISALAGTRGSRASPAIMAALEDPNHEVRFAAVRAVAEFDDARREPMLERLRYRLSLDESTLMRARIARTAEEFAGDWPELVPALADASVLTRRAAESSLLERARDDELAALFEALEAEDRLAIRAARILSAWPSAGKVMEPLIEILESGSPVARPRAALALGLRGDERARPALERVAGSSSHDIAIASLQALQDLDQPASIDRLRSIAEESDNPEVRVAARTAHDVIARVVAPVDRETSAIPSRWGESK